MENGFYVLFELDKSNSKMVAQKVSLHLKRNTVPAYKLYEKYLSNLHDTRKLRQLPSLIGNKNSLDFSTNDYLGLSKHSELRKVAADAALEYGVGATGSRLFSGNFEMFEKFEVQIACDKHAEAALIFNSGFQANISALSSLLSVLALKAKPLVFFDKYNHSSLYQAAFLSKCELIRYKHNDMENLRSKLDEFRSNTRPKFIVSETIFGMDGDFAPLQELADLASEHGAFLYLDEAHATGVFGKHGYGLSTTVDLSSIPHVIMGTFSKALGASGGYVACNKVMRDYLINAAPGFIYSTAPSPMVIAAAQKAWAMVKNMDHERKLLRDLSAILRARLRDVNFNIGASNSHIIPIILGSEDVTIEAQKYLKANNIIVSCVRPPTVPVGTSRLRIALTSLHTEADLEVLIAKLNHVLHQQKSSSIAIS